MRKPVLFLFLTALLVLAVSCNPDMAMERRLAGTWQRAVNEDTTYQMVFRTDGWAEISVFMNGELFDSTKAQWKIDGSMIVLTFSGKYPNAKPFSLEDDTLIIGGDTYQRVDPSGPS